MKSIIRLLILSFNISIISACGGGDEGGGGGGACEARYSSTSTSYSYACYNVDSADACTNYGSQGSHLTSGSSCSDLGYSNGYYNGGDPAPNGYYSSGSGSTFSCPSGTEAPYGDVQIDTLCQTACVYLSNGNTAAASSTCDILVQWESNSSIKASSCGAC
jgi:hypothetical protein